MSLILEGGWVLPVVISVNFDALGTNKSLCGDNRDTFLVVIHGELCLSARVFI